MESSETTVETETTTSGEATERDQESTEGRAATADGITGWFAESTLRIGLALTGLVLLLLAVGQLVGLDLLGLVVDTLNTGAGRWFLVAVVAIILMVVAIRGFDFDFGSA